MNALVVRLAPVFVVVAGFGLVAGPAVANFPGRNGPIYYASENPTPNPEVGTAEGSSLCLPDGTGPPQQICVPIPATSPTVKTNRGPDIVTQKTDELRPIAFTNTPDIHETDPRVSADGRRVVFLRSFPGGPGSYDPDTTGFYSADRGDKNERLLLLQVQAPYYYRAMTWSPDGRLVAVRCQIRGVGFAPPCEIVTLNSDGTQVTSINAALGPKGLIDADLSVTPDGTEVVYSTDAPGNSWEVVVAKLDGSGSRNLGEGANPDISPDGSTIAFASDTGAPGCLSRIEIWTMSAADGANRQNLSRMPCDSSGTRRELYPEWSPDGRRIAYVDAGFQIGHMSPDGSAREELFQSNAGGAEHTVSWSPAPGGVGPRPK